MHRIKNLAFILVLTICTGAASMAQAQDYKRAAGLNLGVPIGVNYKQFLGEKSAIEGTFSYQLINNSAMATVAYQYHIKLVKSFKLYVGGGVNIGAADVTSPHNPKFALGIAPNVGFEYKFNKAPIALGVDYMPQLDFFRGISWEAAMLKLRFCF